MSSSQREPGVEALRTRLARKFTTLADEVNECFQEFHIGAGDFAVELLAPEGPSTGGGKRVLQHLRLRPRREGFATIVAGSVNPLDRVAELRTFEHAALVHAVRFKRAIEISEGEWEQLLRKAEVVLSLANIESRRVGPPPELLTRIKPRRSRVGLAALAAIALAIVVVVALIVRGIA